MWILYVLTNHPLLYKYSRSCGDSQFGSTKKAVEANVDEPRVKTEEKIEKAYTLQEENDPVDTISPRNLLLRPWMKLRRHLVLQRQRILFKQPLTTL
jgi:hypothetical protein